MHMTISQKGKVLIRHSSAFYFRGSENFAADNVVCIMAKHADPQGVPDTPDEWLGQFGTFSIYQVLPEIIEPWGLNVQTQVESKKLRAS